MPAIKHISDLRNYNEVLKEVNRNRTIYLTQNGSGAYAIMTITGDDEHERLTVLHGLLSDLDRAKHRAEKEGWLDEEEIDKVMGF